MNSKTSEKLAYRINDACSALGIGRTSFYRLVTDGKFRTITIAGRVLVPRSEIDRLMAEAMSDAQ